MKIGKVILNKKQTRFLAEAGVNHNNSIENAETLIKTASRAGADIIKFQTYKADKIASQHSPAYWNLEMEPTTNQHELFSKNAMFG